MTPLPEKRNVTKILVSGANGALGQSLLAVLGPDAASSGSRRPSWTDPIFDHVSLASEDDIDNIDWKQFGSVINVAGRVRGTKQQLYDANVTFPVKLAMSARKGNVKHFVQVSSFAVYGDVCYIEPGTPEVPSNDYGVTKLECDRRLLDLATTNFQVATLRLPFLFDSKHPGHFRSLLKAIRILPILPISPNASRRSIISYADASSILHFVAAHKLSGILHAADPEPFDYRLILKLFLEEKSIQLIPFVMPEIFLNTLRYIMPGMYRRFFKSSLLNPNINISMFIDHLEGVEKPLRKLVREL